MKKRNSLIELFRFLFAMNVVIGHGLFPVDTGHFGPDRISVEFFFILSGFLFYHSLDKLKDMKATEAVKRTFITKLKPLLIPMLIGMASNGVLNVLSDYTPKIEVFRYLWYIPAMLAIMVVYAAMRSLIKSDKAFWIIVGTLCVVTTALRFSGNEELFYFDYIRSTAAVSLGMLMAKIPKLNFKHKAISWVILLPIAAAIFYIIYNSLAKYYIQYEAILDLVLYPWLIYVAFGIDFHFAPFDYLGALSFGIYAFQCPARLLAFIGMPSDWIPFGVIFAAAITDDMIRRIVRRHKKKASLNKQESEPAK